MINPDLEQIVRRLAEALEAPVTPAAVVLTLVALECHRHGLPIDAMLAQLESEAPAAPLRSRIESLVAITSQAIGMASPQAPGAMPQLKRFERCSECREQKPLAVRRPDWTGICRECLAAWQAADRRSGLVAVLGAVLALAACVAAAGVESTAILKSLPVAIYMYANGRTRANHWVTLSFFRRDFGEEE